MKNKSSLITLFILTAFTTTSAFAGVDVDIDNSKAAIKEAKRNARKKGETRTGVTFKDQTNDGILSKRMQKKYGVDQSMRRGNLPGTPVQAMIGRTDKNITDNMTKGQRRRNTNQLKREYIKHLNQQKNK